MVMDLHNETCQIIPVELVYVPGQHNSVQRICETPSYFILASSFFSCLSLLRVNIVDTDYPSKV